MKTGLVLEGGAMRGMFTAGVLDAMMNNNITVDGTIVSASNFWLQFQIQTNSSYYKIQYEIF